MTLFLSPAELVELTGKTRYRAQMKALNSMRIPYVLNAANRPIVARMTVERILGSNPNQIAESPEKSRWKSAKTGNNP